MLPVLPKASSHDGTNVAPVSQERDVGTNTAVEAKIDQRLRGHMPALDGVRGLAILMVLMLHFIGDASPTTVFEAAIIRVCGFGMFGVDLFFVLSGFLITGILVDSKTSAHYFRNFYARRAVRIFPLYYGILGCVFFLAPMLPALHGPELETLRREQGWAWLYAVNIFSAARGDFTLPYLDHFWSLAVEEHFYLFWPLLVWVCSRAVLVRVSLGVALLSLSARVALGPHVSSVALYVLTPFRLDSLCLGAFLAACARAPNGVAALGRAVTPMGAIAASVLVLFYMLNHFTQARFKALYHVRDATLVVLLAALMLTALIAPAASMTSRFFSGKPMRLLGKYSYGLYVFHHFISYYFVHRRTEFVVTRWLGSHTLAVLVQASFGVLLSLGISLLSYHLFEKRFLSLKRFWPAGSGSATSEQVARIRPTPLR
jgi:peptidoglycan/LPS O-acetylase OafA/YrhL